MGLDNGVELKSRARLEFNEETPQYLQFACYDNPNIETRERHTYEILYWRKCWGIRNAFFELGFADDESYGKELYADDIRQVRQILVEILCGQRDLDCPIWGIDEYAEQIAYDILRCNWLIDYLEENPQDYCIFYDSY